MDEKFSRRFKSFCNSLNALAEARQRDLSDSFVLSGTSAKFSITFDLAWKVMKDILVQYYAITGFVAGSPREVLREAFKANLISDDTWMEMLKVRNELAHDYDGDIVRTYCNVIVEKYIDLFFDFEFNSGFYEATLVEHVSECFGQLDKDLTKRCLSLEDFNKSYGFNFEKKPQDFSIDYLISFAEYVTNFVYALIRCEIY